MYRIEFQECVRLESNQWVTHGLNYSVLTNYMGKRYICMHIYIYIYIYIYTYVCVCGYVCMCVYVCVCRYACVCRYVGM